MKKYVFLLCMVSGHASGASKLLKIAAATSATVGSVAVIGHHEIEYRHTLPLLQQAIDKRDQAVDRGSGFISIKLLTATMKEQRKVVLYHRKYAFVSRLFGSSAMPKSKYCNDCKCTLVRRDRNVRFYSWGWDGM